MKLVILFTSLPMDNFDIKDIPGLSTNSMEFVYVDIRLGLAHSLNGSDLIYIRRFRGHRITALVLRSLNIYSMKMYSRKLTQIQCRELMKNADMRSLITDAFALVSIHDAQLPLVWELTKVADKPVALRRLSSLHELNGSYHAS